MTLIGRERGKVVRCCNRCECKKRKEKGEEGRREDVFMEKRIQTIDLCK